MIDLILIAFAIACQIPAILILTAGLSSEPADRRLLYLGGGVMILANYLLLIA